MNRSGNKNTSLLNAKIMQNQQIFNVDQRKIKFKEKIDFVVLGVFEWRLPKKGILLPQL